MAEALVRERLAACVNLIPSALSIYHWQGKIEKSSEVILVAKSRTGLFTKIENAVKALSSYECPCIVAMPIVAGSADYLEWLGKETSSG